MEKAKFFATIIGTCVISAVAGLALGYFVIGPIGVSARDSAPRYENYDTPEPLPAYVNYDTPTSKADFLIPDEPEIYADGLTPAHNFLVTSRDGLIVVYETATNRVKETIDIPVNALPAADQERLAQGIRVYSEEALIRILEDYGS